MEEGFEGRCHDEVDEEDCEAEGEHHAVEGDLHLLVLSAKLDIELVLTGAVVDELLDLADRASEAASFQVGGNDRGSLLLQAVDLGGSSRFPDVRHCLQAELGAAGTGDDQVADVGHF